MSAPRLRAGVIGLGVGEKHISGYQQDPRCKVTTMCDIDPHKLADVASRHPGIVAVKEPEAILTDPEIDVVSIATYDTDHFAQTMLALRHNKHVFVEKPLCLHRHELDAIVAAWRDRPDIRLSSNLILRRAPQFVELRRRIEDGELGALYYLEGDYNYGRVHKILDGWRGRIPSYSVVHGGMIHLIDLLVWLTGFRVRSVTAVGNGIATRDSAFQADDLVAALLTFDNGVVAKLTANFGCVHPHFHNVAIYGTAGSFVQTHAGGSAYYWSRDPAEPPSSVESPYPGAQKGDMLPSFVRAILDDETPEVTEQDVFEAMAVSLSIEAAKNAGRSADVIYPLLARQGHPHTNSERTN